MPKVRGSSTEMVASGPMPGSTPTMLPTSTPTKHHIRFCGSSATPKPYQRSGRAEARISEPPLEQREGNLQHVGEQERAGDGDAGGQDRRALQGRGPVAERGDEDTHERAGDHAEIFAEQDEHQRTGEDADPAAPLHARRQDPFASL